MGLTWDEGVTIPHFEPLNQGLSADVAIIGAGITGLTTAYLLSKAGYSVVVVEKDRIGWGATGATTAFLTQNIDTSISDLIWMMGHKKAQAILDSHGSTIDVFEQIISEEQIDCEFMRCSDYLYGLSEKDAATLQNETDAAKSLGFAASFRQDEKLRFSNTGYLELENQAKFHPLKYLQALVGVLQKQHVRIFEKTNADDLQSESDITIKTKQGDIQAQWTCVATYTPLNNKLYFKKAQYTSYVMEVQIPTGSLAEGIYEDMQDPYHYFRVDRQEDHDRLIFGGEDHRADLPVSEEKCFQALAEALKQLLADIPYIKVRQWKGPIIEPVDGLALIGPLEDKRVLYATGFSGNGMTYAGITAHIMADLVQQKENPWSKLYDPNRTLAARSLLIKGMDYSRELFGSAVKNTLKYWK